ncbi:shikimate O-hydroxycinnamoyltransferase [Trifolium repens]|nr:shikimate O-hydroxycinnamoyltransferase [Trifolium repens]
MVNSSSMLDSAPTRVQLVMAWIYKRAVSIMGLDFKTALFTMSVDLRKRMVPPLSEKCVGNIIWFSSIYVCGQGGNRIRGFGRFKDQLSIECNDQGVSFLVANIIGTKLSTILQNPTENLLNPLFPDELQWKKMDWNENVATAFNFMNDWAKLNREEGDSNSKLSLPYNLLYAGDIIFPQGDLPNFPEVGVSFQCMKLILDGGNQYG